MSTARDTARASIAHVEAALRGLFPDGVAVRCCDDRDPAPTLYPIESEAIARAIEKRRLEFARGRGCARDALAQIGCATGPIPVGPNRAPIWPAGFVGSITHCAGLVAAVVGRETGFRALGMDAEPSESLEADLAARICTPAEIERTSQLPGLDPGRWRRLIFGAKECVHKCVAPLTGETLEFQDVCIELDVEAGTFRVEPVTDRARGLDEVALLRGRFAATEGWLAAGASLPVDGRS